MPTLLPVTSILRTQHVPYEGTYQANNLKYNDYPIVQRYALKVHTLPIVKRLPENQKHKLQVLLLRLREKRKIIRMILYSEIPRTP